MSNSCFDLNSYSNNPCPEPESARVRAIAFSYVSHNLGDPSVTHNWVNAIATNNAFIIHDVRGSYDGGAATEAAGYGFASLRKSGAQHTLTYNHLFNHANIDFYNLLSKKSGQLRIWFVTDTLLFSSAFDKTVFVDAKYSVTEDLTSTVEWTVTVKWSDINMVEIYNKPPLIFNSCSTMQKLLECYEPCCFPDTCGMTCEIMDELVQSIRTVFNGISAPGPYGTSISGILFSWPVFIPSLAFDGNEIVWNGQHTGSFIEMITNEGYLINESTDIRFTIMFTSSGLCPDFSIIGNIHLEFDDMGNWTQTIENVNWCTNVFGLAIADTSSTCCLPCSGNTPKCSTFTPLLSALTHNTPPLPAGDTTITLSGDLLVSGDPCCEVISLSTTNPLTEAYYVDSQTITIRNGNDTPITNNFEIVVWTTCGMVVNRLQIIIV